ncbi:MAG: hypothetical protein M3O61_00490 [Gemmatimonadota bacterium]|nr:hypothetical protein [Gemmatimonadota bacterium]
MSFTALINNNPIFLLGLGFVVLGVGHYWWRFTRAKSTAEEWLRQHHYRVRQLRVPLFSGMNLAPSWVRNSENAFTFRAIIDDTELGGTGTLCLRVWINWLGTVYDEVEIAWEHQPDGLVKDEHPLFERLFDTQLALLQRVADGETSFYSPRRSQNGGAEFDQTVEHLLALSRRGLITCSEPRPGMKGETQYSDISNVAITSEGKSFLGSRRA